MPRHLSGQSWVLLTTGDGCQQQMKPIPALPSGLVTDNTKLRFAPSLPDQVRRYLYLIALPRLVAAQ